jgi:hypothetical protein
MSAPGEHLPLSQIHNEQRETAVEPVEFRLQKINQVLHAQIERPPQADPYIRAYALSVQSTLEFDGPIKEFICETLERWPDLEGSYLVNKMRSALQDHLYFPEARPGAENEPLRHRIIVQQHGRALRYPHDYSSPEAWSMAFEAVLSDPDVFGEFLMDVWTRALASNVSERYKALKALGTLARGAGRIDTLKFFDVGPSQHAGANHIASGLPFERVTVFKPNTNQALNIPGTQLFAHAMNVNLPVEIAMGVDMYYPIESRSWARSCSHYPSELLDKDRVALYDTLIMQDQPNVLFYKADFTEFDHEAFARHERAEGRADQKYDIVNFSTVLYQSTPEEREKMLGHATRIAQEFIVMQDFAAIDPNDPSKLIFRTNWQDDPFPYRTFVMDMREDPPIWHEIFRWRDGRCREMVMGMGARALTHGLRTALWKPDTTRP